MPMPRECNMPDLSNLEPLLPRLITVLLMGERGRITRKPALYRRNFVRLIDKALVEYGEAREYILLNVEESKLAPEEIKRSGQHIYNIGFANYIENCINAVSRLFKLLDRLNSEREITLPRTYRRSLHTKYDGVINIRNYIEHIDEQIQKDETSPGNPIMISVNKENDGVVVSRLEIKFNQLATVISSMHKIGLHLLNI